MEPKDNRQLLTEKHSFINDSIFKMKVAAFTGKRMLTNLVQPVQRFTNQNKLSNKRVIAFSESDLWNVNDNDENWPLTAGKVQNLRIACNKINGIEVKAGEVFSFWRHVGNPNFGKGYVIGREIREGCIVPTKAGGLCQLSNALYDAALKAKFEILERHRHTKVVMGSLAEQDRDATVKWNYVDLRFRSDYDFKIVVELTSDKLVVAIKSKLKNLREMIPSIATRRDNKLNDCYSCGNFACYKHPDRRGVKKELGNTMYVLDTYWPEYNEYIKEHKKANDGYIVTVQPKSIFTIPSYAWSVPVKANTKTLFLQSVQQAIKLRLGIKQGKNVFELQMQLAKQLALQVAKKIPVNCTHIVVQQHLLPFLYESGALGGRTFDVLMTRLPLEKLQDRLNAAHTTYPNSTTLNDYRVDNALVELENKALTQARSIITPHFEIASIFRNKSVLLPWYTKTEEPVTTKGKMLLLPASALGRKGAYEMRKLAKELNCTVAIAGNTKETATFWEDIKTVPFNGDFTSIALVVYPAYIEHQPRLLLKALAKGVPAVASVACGLHPTTNLHIVPTGNYKALKEAVESVLQPESIFA